MAITTNGKEQLTVPMGGRQPAHQKLLVGGQWLAGKGKTHEIKSPYDRSVVGTVPLATPEELEQALQAVDRGFGAMSSLAAHERAHILSTASELIKRDREVLARTIALEAGKAIKFALVEVDRAVQTFQFAAEEAKRLHGETIPMDAAIGSEGRMGFWLRVPRGPVVAIPPFNFPLNLVAHKVAPALGAGNSVIIKPASATPLTSYHLGRLLVEAGAPAGAVNVVTGEGAVVGDALVTDHRIKIVSFTGSPPVGKGILARAGLKRVILELGGNSAVIVAADADFEKTFPAIVTGSFANSGQVCISVQRIYVHESRYQEFAGRFIEAVKGLKVGDPIQPDTDVGPMISLAEAERAESWLQEAVDAGARVAIGGSREGALFQPTVLTDITPDMKVACRELFAPIVSLVPFSDLDEAFALANGTSYGLQGAVFTESLDTAFRAIRELEVGGIMINDSSMYRADHMPYGGVKNSGLGREGLRFAMEEMTEIKMAVINL
jgi:acyl-CoA reductase-like NAD-dependent aldehyde dehydrogenase